MARATVTVCPRCLRRLDGALVRRGDEVWLQRECPEHGQAEALVWRGPPDFDAWRRAGATSTCCEPPPNPACPDDCGLCAGHARQTCCVLLEVTQRCDLACPVCYAGAGEEAPEDPSMTTIEGWYRRLLEVAPGCNVQLSGGEPTVRDDLPEVIALGRSLGHSFFQLNTNGVRLATQPGYAEELAAAGLATVFLQFDGVDDAPYVALRGRPLAAAKASAVERCAEAGLGVVLVPTVVDGVNLDRLGAILVFALEHAPAVRGIHLQPMALLGRYAPGHPEAARVTLPDAMRALVAQSGGRLTLDQFTPGDCEHALCSFSREYLRADDGVLVPLESRRDGCGCGAPDLSRPAGAPVPLPPAVAPTDKAAHVAARWAAPAAGAHGGEPSVEPTPRMDSDGDPWGAIIEGVRANTFSVSGMAFQDAWTLDLDRLRHCYLHVLSPDGRVVPFCAYNLTAVDGHGVRAGRQGEAGRQDAETASATHSSSTARHRADCMVCGSRLLYGDADHTQVCFYCGRQHSSSVRCTEGHFVCDACHAAEAVEIIRRVCLSERRETDAVSLMQTIRSHPAFPVHGPEHHSLVPAVILAALRNAGATISDEQIVTAIRRGQTVVGGACAHLGVCGAASGVGIALSMALSATPLDGSSRQIVQGATASVLAALALDAPRCCQRDSWLAIREAAGLFADIIGSSLTAGDLICRQAAWNAECIGARCPLWPHDLSFEALPAASPDGSYAGSVPGSEADAGRRR